MGENTGVERREEVKHCENTCLPQLLVIEEAYSFIYQFNQQIPR